MLHASNAGGHFAIITFDERVLGYIQLSVSVPGHSFTMNSAACMTEVMTFILLN